MIRHIASLSFVLLALAGICLSGCLDQSEDKSTEVVAVEQPAELTAVKQPTEQTEEQSGYILINSSADVQKVIGTEVDTALGPKGTYVTAQTGRTHLIIHMDMENNGCPRFVVDPNHYVVVMDDVEYAPLNITRVIQPRLTILDRVTLRDAGKVSGCLVFEVPYSEELEYAVEYIGPDECDVIVNQITEGD